MKNTSRKRVSILTTNKIKKDLSKEEEVKNEEFVVLVAKCTF